MANTLGFEVMMKGEKWQKWICCGQRMSNHPENLFYIYMYNDSYLQLVLYLRFYNFIRLYFVDFSIISARAGLSSGAIFNGS